MKLCIKIQVWSMNNKINSENDHLLGSLIVPLDQTNSRSKVQNTQEVLAALGHMLVALPLLWISSQIEAMTVTTVHDKHKTVNYLRQMHRDVIYTLI